MVKRILGIVFLLFAVSVAHIAAQGQVYPVQANVFLTPPYSPSIASYYSPAVNKMSAQLLVNENQGGLPVNVRLRVVIEDISTGRRIATRSNYMPPRPIVLQTGIPYIISGPELEPYLRPDNLEFEGVDVQQILNTKKLPEGNYTFRIEVLEYYRGMLISNPKIGTQMAMLIDNPPPTWVLPTTSGSVDIEAREPQSITFSWLPHHLNTFVAQYEFKMVELPDVPMDPNVAFQTLTPVFATVTGNTSLVYDISAPPLVPGRKYACQVTATDADRLDMFINGGKTELIVFTWGQACKMPTDITHALESPTSEKVTWKPADGNTGFVVQYREVTDSSYSDFYTDEVSYPQVISKVEHIIRQLKAGRTYECQVKALCNLVSSDFTVPFTFSTKPTPQTTITSTCGQSFANIDTNLIDKTPIAALVVGDTINVGGFTASITEVSGSPGSGFSGKCIVNTTTIGIRIKSHFSNIKVNTNHQVYSGVVIGDYDPSNLVDLDEVKNDAQTIIVLAEQTQKELKSMVKDVKTYLENDPTMVDIMLDLDTAHNIPEGTREGLELVNEGVKEKEKGQKLIQQGRVEEGEALLNSANSKLDEGKLKLKEQAGYNTDKIAERKVVFSSDPAQAYGFDSLKYTQLLNNYEHYYDNHVVYGYPWKSLPIAGTDVVHVDISDLSPSDVVFKSENEVPQTLVGNTLNITTTDNYIKAFRKLTGTQGDSLVAAGKLNLVRYQSVTPDIVVVEVNGATADLSGLQSGLNAIFKQAVVNFNIKPTETLTVSDLPATFGATGVTSLSNYTEDMNTVIEAYKAANENYSHNTYYLFLVNGSSSDRAGFMPLSRQWGFIFPDKSPSTPVLYRTIAHELAHGAFRLRHTFSDDLGGEAIPQGSTNNLMDYPGANEETSTALWKNQWDNIHNPAFGMYFFQDEKEGASTVRGIPVDFKVNNIDVSSFAVDGKVIYLTPANTIFVLPSTATPYFLGTAKDVSTGSLVGYKVPNGVLRGFRKDNKSFVAYYRFNKTSGQYVFDGYYEKNNYSNNGRYINNEAKNLPESFKVLTGSEDSNCNLLICLLDKNKGEYSKALNIVNYYGNGDVNPDLIIPSDNPIKTIPLGTECLNGYGKTFYDSRATNPNVDKEQLLRIAKMVDLIGEHIYNEYSVQANGLQRNEVNAYWSTQNFDDTPGGYNNLETALTKYLNDFNAYVDLINQTTDSKWITLMVGQMTVGQLTSLDVDTRIRILSIMSKAPMTGRWLGGYNGEYVANSILRTLKKENYQEFLTKLKDNYLLNDLIYRVDGKNYAEFVFRLADMIVQTYQIPSNEQLLADGKVFRWNKTFWSDKKIVYHSKNFTQYLLSGTQESQFKLTYSTELTELDNYLTMLDPYEIIGLTVETDLTYLNIKADGSKIVPIPAILFHWILDKQDNETNKQLFKAALFTVFSAYSVSAMAASTTDVGLWFECAGLMTNAASVFVNLSDISSDPSYQGFVDFVDYANTVYALGSVVKIGVESMTTKASDFVSLWRRYKNRTTLIADDAARMEKLANSTERLLNKMGIFIDEVPVAFRPLVQGVLENNGSYQIISGELRFVNGQGTEIAKIVNNELKILGNGLRDGGTLISETENGYKLVKDAGGNLGFDLGFKVSRPTPLTAEEVNSFLYKFRGAKADGQPYLNGTAVNEKILQPGEKLYVIEYKSATSPGGWATKDKIYTVQELREKLAVLKSWKNEDDILNPLVIREYEVVNPVKVREGTVGPQIEDFVTNAGHQYPGTGHQYEFMEGKWDLDYNPPSRFLRVVEETELSYIKNGFKVNSSTIDDAFKHVDDITLNGTGNATFSTSSGLVGCHNEANFNKLLTSNGGRIEIVSSTPKVVNGVKDIEYKVLQLDIQGNPIPGQYYASGSTFTKTVYDPAIFPEASMKDLGYKAFKDAIDNNKFDLIDPNTGNQLFRTFEGVANSRTISGYYKEVNGEKIISTWWIKN